MGFLRIETKRIAHDVERGSNLDLILRGMNGAVNKLADALGGGLQAIALALSTPKDNSAEVQKQIDAVEQKVRSASEALQTAIDNQKGE